MKINCIYHRDQLITNFCRDKHCLMPLCPECISEHTQYHEDQRSRPQYATIHEILADVHTQIVNCVEMLEEDKCRNGHLLVNIQTVADKVRQKIQAAKELVHRAVDESFCMLQKDINKQLQKLHQQKGIYSLPKSQKQDKLVLQHLDQLSAMINTLKSDRGLSNIIYFFREKQADVNNFHTQFISYLHANQNYHPKLQINTQALYSLDSVIGRIIKVGSYTNLKKKAQPLQQNNNSMTPGKQTTTQRLKQKANAQFVESQVAAYSPHRSRVNYTKPKNSAKIDASKVDGEYQKLSKKVAVMREENDRLTKLLIRTGQSKKF